MVGDGSGSSSSGRISGSLSLGALSPPPPPPPPLTAEEDAVKDGASPASGTGETILVRERGSSPLPPLPPLPLLSMPPLPGALLAAADTVAGAGVDAETEDGAAAGGTSTPESSVETLEEGGASGRAGVGATHFGISA